jgi:hypothetical protein
MDISTFNRLAEALDAAGYQMRGLKEKNLGNIKLIISPKTPISWVNPSASDNSRNHEKAQ